MKATLARCGYRCDLCPACRINIKTPEDRKRVSAGWRKYYGLRISPERISCDGCTSRKKNSVLLDDNCPIRKCAGERGFATCAPCPDFICSKLASHAHAAERALEKFKGAISSDDFDLFIRPYAGRKYLEEIRRKKP